jgi:hypothetical protein
VSFFKKKEFHELLSEYTQGIKKEYARVHNELTDLMSQGKKYHDQDEDKIMLFATEVLGKYVELHLFTKNMQKFTDQCIKTTKIEHGCNLEGEEDSIDILQKIVAKMDIAAERVAINKDEKPEFYDFFEENKLDFINLCNHLIHVRIVRSTNQEEFDELMKQNKKTDSRKECCD